MKIELLRTAGCPHADAARVLVTNCLHRLNVAVPVSERVGAFPSPSVLVDGVDVMGELSGDHSRAACRLDVPTAERVLAALRHALEYGPR